MLGVWTGNIVLFVSSFFCTVLIGQYVFLGGPDDYEISSSVHPLVLTGALGIVALLMLARSFGVVVLDGSLTGTEATYFSSVFTAASILLYLVSGEFNSLAAVLLAAAVLVLGNIGLIVALVVPGPWIGGQNQVLARILVFLGPVLVVVGGAVFVLGVNPFASHVDNQVSASVFLLAMFTGVSAVVFPLTRLLFSGLVALVICGGTLLMTYLLTDILTDPTT